MEDIKERLDVCSHGELTELIKYATKIKAKKGHELNQHLFDSILEEWDEVEIGDITCRESYTDIWGACHRSVCINGITVHYDNSGDQDLHRECIFFGDDEYHNDDGLYDIRWEENYEKKYIDTEPPMDLELAKDVVKILMSYNWKY